MALTGAGKDTERAVFGNGTGTGNERFGFIEGGNLFTA
jgi:hypothetical protein